MASITSSLPRPRNATKGPEQSTYDDDTYSEKQLVKPSDIPPYGERSGWRPKAQSDFGNGGAYPEVHVAQYPLNMGRKGKSKSSSNALTVQVDSAGQIKYDAIAKQGHSTNRIVQTSFQDLIPLRQRANAGDISLERPSEEEVADTTLRTQDAISKILNGKLETTKPRELARHRNEPTYVRYTPSNMMVGSNTADNRQKIIKMVDVAEDPLAPPKFKHTKVPPRPPSPPAPILRSPPRKLTHKDQEDWYIPPSISNWKNPKGYTIPLDKRLAADGRGLNEATINDNKAKLAEALYAADRSAREEIRERAAMQQKLAEKEEAEREERLRELAKRARAEKATKIARTSENVEQEVRSRERSFSRSPPSSSRYRPSESREDSGDEEDIEAEAAARKRRDIREDRKREVENELRRSRMGEERRIQTLAREQNRDISEKVALGISKPTKKTGDDQFDSRLFSQVSTGGFSSSINEDQVYDKSLFAAQEAVQSVYRPRGRATDQEDAQSELERVAGEKRFEGLGNTSTEAREGPVEFEIDSDPFGVSKMMDDIKQSRNFGLDDSGRRKRAKPNNGD
jgi:SNW domain-containing protein 1